MYTGKTIKTLFMPLFLALCFSASVHSADAVTVTVTAADKSNNRAAGFKFSKKSSTDQTVAGISAQPIVHYQQNIHMLSAVNDRPTFQVFGDGRVLVHYPVYMKMAGDYEMQLDEVELIDLLHSLSDNGVMDFDSDKHKAGKETEKQSLKAKGQYFAISDAVETIIEIRLDEYQKNNSTKTISNFYKKFKWENLEHDAKRFKKLKALEQSNASVSELKRMMKDPRLTKRDQP